MIGKEQYLKHVELGAVTLVVADLHRSVNFYGEMLGLRVLLHDKHSAVLGAGDVPLIELIEQPTARRRPRPATGLYHIALLLPTRKALAQSLRRLLDAAYPLRGSADHLVSEAVYLDDPDGNGIELYRDRPREEWQWRADGELLMHSLAFDLAGLLTDAKPRGEARMNDTSSGMRVGHIHLQVSDLGAAEKFYGDALGFKVTARLPGALFVAADGYHHHVGLNTWHSAGAPPAPEGVTGLRSFTIKLKDAAEIVRLRERLIAAGVDHCESAKSAPSATTPSVRFCDPWGNEITARMTEPYNSMPSQADDTTQMRSV